MKTKADKPRVILVSTPWPLFNRPSIQLGALTAFLRHGFPNLSAESRHFYLKLARDIGYDLYAAISERTWLAEAVYAALLYPGRFDEAAAVFSREVRRSSGSPVLRGVEFKALTEKVGKATDAFIAGLPWHEFDLAGFSICLCQLTSGLFCIREVKKRAPGISIVVGGSIIAGSTGADLLDVFPEIDFAVNGEGEVPLSRLVSHLVDDPDPASVPEIAGLIRRSDRRHRPRRAQISHLDGLPPPAYGEYFALLASFSGSERFFPTLPLEMSRGCLWRKKNRKGALNGCAFCNLNLQWEGYRTKTPGRVAAEIDAMTSKYRLLSAAFMDNLLPADSGGAAFGTIGGLQKDLRLFGEIRATTPAGVLEAMCRAGMAEVQIGIEALSSRLLRKLNKGTTAIQNVEIMKHCEALGLAHGSNLILQFPGSDPEDVAETLHNLSFVQVYRPLRTVRFWLGLGSPVSRNPRAYGIRAVYNHPNYARLFPPSVSRNVRFMIQQYRGDRTFQRKLWQPVKRAIRSWKRSYAELHRGYRSGPILSYRDGGDFLIIRCRRIRQAPMTHRLTGTSREIYLYCRHNRSLKNIVHRFGTLDEDRIVGFLRMMVDKKLMFAENDRYLSLAIREGVRDRTGTGL